MIDEDLYQQAADELNSDRRRPHIWARACALASDDQDEARYLYTNLRVEELLAERTHEAPLAGRGLYETENLEATLLLEPGSEAVTGDFSDAVGEFSAFLDDGNIPLAPDSLPSSENATTPDHHYNASEALDAGILDSSLAQSTRHARFVIPDSSPLDDTYAGLEDPTEVFQKELEKLKAEQGGVNIFESTAAFSRHLDGHIDDEKNSSPYAPDDLPADGESDTDFHLDPAEIDRLASMEVSTSPDILQQQMKHTVQHTQGKADLQLEPIATEENTPLASSAETQPNVQQTQDVITPVDKLLSDADYRPTDNAADDGLENPGVEDILADAVYEPAGEPDHSESNLDWLDEEPTLAREPDTRRQPLIIDDDTLEATLDASFFEIDSSQESDEVAENPEPAQAAAVPDAHDIDTLNVEFDQTARTDTYTSDASVENSIESAATDSLKTDSLKTDSLETDSTESDSTESDSTESDSTESDSTESDSTESDSTESMQSFGNSLAETLALTATQLDSVDAADLLQPESGADEPREPLLSREAAKDPALSGPLEHPSLGEPLEDPSLSGPLEDSSLSGPLEDSSLSGPLEDSSLSGPLEDSSLSGPLEDPSLAEPLEHPSLAEPLKHASLREPLEGSYPGEPLEDSSLGGPLEDPSLDGRLEFATGKDQLAEPSLHGNLSEQPVETDFSDSADVDGRGSERLEQPLGTPSHALPAAEPGLRDVAPEIDKHTENATTQDSPSLQARSPEVSLETSSSEQLQQIAPAIEGLSENKPEQDISQPPSLENSQEILSLDTAVPPPESEELSAIASVADELNAPLAKAAPAQDTATNHQGSEFATDLSGKVENASADHSGQLSILPPMDLTTVDDSKAAFAALTSSPPASVRLPAQDVTSIPQVSSKPIVTKAQETTHVPVDLTDGTEGKQYAIYHRRGKTQIVSTSGSWTALILTLPFLVYRQLFGTAVTYSIMAVILLGGLIVSSLAWYDAGESVAPLVQASAISFGLLSFIGLAYLPFRYGNLWRCEKLERRGFELLALVSAESSGQAMTIARRKAQLDI